MVISACISIVYYAIQSDAPSFILCIVDVSIVGVT